MAKFHVEIEIPDANVSLIESAAAFENEQAMLRHQTRQTGENLQASLANRAPEVLAAPAAITPVGLITEIANTAVLQRLHVLQEQDAERVRVAVTQSGLTGSEIVDAVKTAAALKADRGKGKPSNG